MTVDSTPKIAITNTDTREIDNLRLSVTFLINGQPYYDYEDQGTFNRVVNDGLSGENGTWNGSQWVGNFLHTENSQSTGYVYDQTTKAYFNADPTGFDAPGPVSPQITILNEDTRAITGLRVTADFTINGQPYTDYEDIGPFDRTYGLVLNGENGTWDGTKWVGNFLSTQYSGFDTQIDPGLLTFLNVLFIICAAGATALAAASREMGLGTAGGSWSLRQLI
jgi:alpha-galactosidase